MYRYKVSERGSSMKITEFCNGRNVEQQAVRKYIDRHPEQFEEHVKRVGREIDFDEAAFKILEKKYPMPQLIQIVDNPETLEKLEETRADLDKAKDIIINLQNKINEQSRALAAAEATKLLLQDKELQLSKSESRLTATEAELNVIKDKLALTTQQLEIEKNKTWWQKLRGK